MPEATSFSEGVDEFLRHIRPFRHSEREFPRGLKQADAKRPKKDPTKTWEQSLHSWFVQLVNKYCKGNPELAALHDNIAAFAICRWQKDTLTYASVSVLVAHECELAGYYCDPGKRASYLRLDLNYETLGKIFTHPLPHIHVNNDDEPRFCLEGNDSGNVLIDFIEFVFRHYVPDRWLQWAQLAWKIEQDKLTDYDEETDPFNTIVQAFKENQFGVLSKEKATVDRIKNALRAAKDALCPEHMSLENRRVVRYP